MDNIRNYLINRRLELNLSQIDFAKKLGISYSLYSKVELGLRKPSNKLLVKLKKENPKVDINIFF